MNYLRKLVGTRLFNTKQCSAELSLRIILHYSLKHLWETLRMGKNPAQQPNFTYFPHQKNALNKFTLSTTKVSFVAVAIVVVSFFLTSGFMYTCVMLVLLIDVYWMLYLAWQKHWMVKVLPMKSSILPTCQCYFSALPFFISNFTKLQLTPLQMGLCDLWTNQIKWIFQISGNKSDETSYLMP